jgi:cephalosporin hydroxylase
MIVIDGDTVAFYEKGCPPVEHAIGSPEAFRIISQAWLRSGWDAKYVYSFTWLGRPIIQLPEDLMRIQELIFTLQPDLIVETGVAHGGSLIFYASLCQAMAKGRVVGVDREIRPQNRKAIETHDLFSRITLIEGDSVNPKTIAKVREYVPPRGCVLILLDSLHSKDHVRAELEAYSPFVTRGSYIVAMDGIMGQLAGAPRTHPDWTWNNPKQAALEFAAEHSDFAIVEPGFPFNEGAITERVTYWPGAFLRRAIAPPVLDRSFKTVRPKRQPRRTTLRRSRRK